MTDKPEKFTDEELEKAIKLHDELIRFYKKVQFNQNQLPFKAVQKFYNLLLKERQLRREKN
ncbi:MAG: hypothetical protein KGD61_04870 [Candidatus Lokiarchaeota archaeon]|nr:hypothetical protein [Candidatus Lokiarchaeota archaeon]